MRVAVSQPAYLPWLGYFALVDAADTMVLLDSVAVAKQSWQLRNRVRLSDGRLTWLSIPTHASMGEPLNEVRIDYTRGWQQRHWRTLEQAYAKAPGWRRIDRYRLAFEPGFRPGLTEFTCRLIGAIAQDLDIRTRIVRASELAPTRVGKTERLEDLLGQLGATEYLSSRNSTYLDGLVSVGDAELRWFDYEPQPYEQGGLPWQSHLSIVDLLAHSADPLSVIRAGVQA